MNILWFVFVALFLGSLVMTRLAADPTTAIIGMGVMVASLVAILVIGSVSLLS